MERKRFLIPVLVFIMLLGFAQVAKADFVQSLDKVSFYVVDDDTSPSGGDNSVTLAISNFCINPDTLQYSRDNNTWTDVSGKSLSIATGSNDWERVWFRLGMGGSHVTEGALTFSAADGKLWNAVAIKWSNGFTFNIAGDNDNVAPVPIPATVWLLGSGLFGLVVFGGRRRNKIS